MGKHRQEFILAMVKFCQRFRLLVRLSLQATALSNVPNVALYDLSLIHLVDVADKFDVDPLSLLGFERQIFVANITLRLQLTESGPALCLISEETDLPEFLAHEFFLGIASRSYLAPNALAVCVRSRRETPTPLRRLHRSHDESERRCRQWGVPCRLSQ